MKDEPRHPANNLINLIADMQLYSSGQVQGYVRVRGAHMGFGQENSKLLPNTRPSGQGPALETELRPHDKNEQICLRFMIQAIGFGFVGLRLWERRASLGRGFRSFETRVIFKLAEDPGAMHRAMTASSTAPQM